MSNSWFVLSNFVTNDQVEKLQVLWSENKILLSIKSNFKKLNYPVWIVLAIDDKIYYKFDSFEIINKESCVFDKKDVSKDFSEKLELKYKNVSEGTVDYSYEINGEPIELISQTPLSFVCSKEIKNKLQNNFVINKKLGNFSCFISSINCDIDKLLIVEEDNNYKITETQTKDHLLEIDGKNIIMASVIKIKENIYFTSKEINLSDYAFPEKKDFYYKSPLIKQKINGYLSYLGKNEWELSSETPKSFALIINEKEYVIYNWNNFSFNANNLELANCFVSLPHKTMFLYKKDDTFTLLDKELTIYINNARYPLESFKYLDDHLELKFYASIKLEHNKEYSVGFIGQPYFMVTFQENKDNLYKFKINKFKECKTLTISDFMSEFPCKRIEAYSDKSFIVDFNNKEDYEKTKEIVFSKRFLIKEYDNRGKTIKISKFDCVKSSMLFPRCLSMTFKAESIS